ncbi:S41 family peptidase [Colwellia asteriadis]
MLLNQSSQRNSLVLSLAISLALLSGCGGSGGGESNAVTNTKTTVTETTWVKGNFNSASSFAARCENPRSGASPITGEAYPDKAGSELLEKFWQRSFTNETYLWYQDVIDQDPNNFSLVEYFDQLKTMEVTDSGALKDQFHWMEPTSGVEERSQLGVTYGYGISYDRQQTQITPRKWVVKNVTPETQAALQGVSRGSTLLEIDGADFVNGTSQAELDTINAGLSSQVEGEEHIFKFADLNGSEYEVTLATAAISGVPVQIAKTIDTPQGKVGYFLFNTFGNATAEKDLFDSFTQFKEDNITDLVVDLRYNGGGFLALSSQLAYMVAGKEATQGKTYDRLIYNDKLSADNRNIGFYDTTIDLRRLIGGDSIISANQPLPTLDLSRVYVLTTGSSCSASESFMNSLRGIDVEVIQIGETTCGKPYGFVSEDNCGSTYFTVQFRGENHKGFGDYADGFIPATLPEAGKLAQVQGCPIKEDYLHALGDEQELLLSSALYYQVNNTCPEIAESVSLHTGSLHGVGVYNKSQQAIENSVEQRIKVRTPLQNAIIDDIYYDKFRNVGVKANAEK